MSNPVFSDGAFDRAGHSSNADSMTVNGSIMKTFILGLVFILTSFVVIAYLPNFYGSLNAVIMASAIGAFVVGLIISFKPATAPALSVIYAVLESVVVTVISLLMNHQYNGIVFEAVTYTMIAFFTMLILYRIGVIRATETFKSVIITATAAIAVSYLILFVLSFFGIRPDWFYGNSQLSIGINAVIIVVAALNLILDFDFIEKGSSMNMPKYMEWYAAFGLILTIIWLYLEILRILSKIKSR
ncbi:MAG: Bax inhibitor-1/YccA family protein [Mucispirillum sp.]|nr:Bax inhibitor-1/YccA family protein [Mucispirillum sp.]